MKKICRFLLSAVLVFSLSCLQAPACFAAGSSPFTFQGSMSKEVLRSYASRAVTHAGFCVENLEPDPIFEEDLRMLRRIGAKYIGRAAYYSWGGNLSAAEIEKHYQIAKERAEAAHKQDPEMILQAGIFEIAYRSTVNNTAIPKHVFEAFGQKVENRNFRFEDVVFPADTKDPGGGDNGIGCWGNDASGVPNINSVEAQMYFYYQMTRYIDAGYEAFHMGQAEKMMLYSGNDSAGAAAWDKLLTLAREYAKTHARRGVVLFDCHVALGSPGIKMGNRLIFDIQGAPMFPNETEEKNGAQMCEIGDYRTCEYQYIGRLSGGEHPLGFSVENNFTILEFDNFGGNGRPGIATKNAFYSWGYDDVTWFSVQPEQYRNQFLKEADAYVKSHNLDSAGKQQYFIQFSCRRVITPEVQDYPELLYTPGKYSDVDFVFNYCDKEKTGITYNSDNTYTLTVKKDYRANRRSDACPNGFGQEDTIRELFLGKGAKEDSSLLPTGPVAGSNGDPVTLPPPSQNATPSAGAGSSGVSTASDENGTGNEFTASENSSDDVEVSSGSGNGLDTSSDGKSTGGKQKSALPLILGIVGGVVLLAAAGSCFYFLYFKRRRGKTDS